VPVVIAHHAFTPPPPGKLLIYGNGPQGGVNWQPISYNEKTQMIYVCSAVSWVGVEAANQPYPGPGKNYTGVAGTAGFGWPEGTGTFTAIDASSGKVVWQKTFPEPCYAGTARTAGGLVFVGRNAGQLQAYDATSGKQLWSFQTGAGANNTATIFEQNGKEYVAFQGSGHATRRRRRRSEHLYAGERRCGQDRFREQLRVLSRSHRPRRETAGPTSRRSRARRT
jgi:outer membrane protein assembly factor BamB